jgi:hypothetical protein
LRETIKDQNLSETRAPQETDEHLSVIDRIIGILNKYMQLSAKEINDYESTINQKLRNVLSE